MTGCTCTTGKDGRAPLCEHCWQIRLATVQERLAIVKLWAQTTGEWPEDDQDDHRS
jgi:hypothetical protein